MSYWILPESGIPVSATTIQRMTYDERNTDEMKTRMRHYDDRRQVTFEAQSADISNTLSGIDAFRIIDADNENEQLYEEFTRVIDDAALLHADDVPAIADIQFSPYVGMQLALSRGGEGEVKHATVKRRLVDKEGKPVGDSHKNPLFDSRKYEVE